MLKFKVKCDWCGKIFKRETRRINEAQRNNWRQFCSPPCLQKSRLQGKELACDNPNCSKKFYRRRADIKKTTRSFCSHSCRAIVFNLEKGIRGQKKCINPDCSNQAPSYKKFCSRECFRNCFKTNKQFASQFLSNKPIAKNIYAKRVIKAIKNFVITKKRLPFKCELNPFYRPARIAFGTWNNAVKAAGFNPNQLKFTHKYIANDKHVCDSLAEKIIDDWLYAREIKHQRDVYYPGQKRFKTDFKIGNYWFEFFGLEGQLKRYDELKKKKLHLIKKLNLKLIKIYPHDLFPKNKLDKVLKILLN